MDRIENVCNFMFDVMDENSIYNIADLFFAIKDYLSKTEERTVSFTEITDNDLEDAFYDLLDDYPREEWWSDDKSRDLYRIWNTIKLCWRTKSTTTHLCSLLDHSVGIHSGMTNDELMDTIHKKFTIEPPLCLIKTYYALPCATEIFEVKGITANTSDFGTTESEGDGEYGCAYHRFIPHECPNNYVLKKYGINLEEYHSVCVSLKSELYVGHCGWCS